MLRASISPASKHRATGGQADFRSPRSSPPQPWRDIFRPDSALASGAAAVADTMLGLDKTPDPPTKTAGITTNDKINDVEDDDDDLSMQWRAQALSTFSCDAGSNVDQLQSSTKGNSADVDAGSNTVSDFADHVTAQALLDRFVNSFSFEDILRTGSEVSVGSILFSDSTGNDRVDSQAQIGANSDRVETTTATHPPMTNNPSAEEAFEDSALRSFLADAAATSNAAQKADASDSTPLPRCSLVSTSSSLNNRTPRGNCQVQDPLPVYSNGALFEECDFGGSKLERTDKHGLQEAAEHSEQPTLSMSNNDAPPSAPRGVTALPRSESGEIAPNLASYRTSHTLACRIPEEPDCKTLLACTLDEFGPFSSDMLPVFRIFAFLLDNVNTNECYRDMLLSGAKLLRSCCEKKRLGGIPPRDTLSTFLIDGLANEWETDFLKVLPAAKSYNSKLLRQLTAVLINVSKEGSDEPGQQEEVERRGPSRPASYSKVKLAVLYGIHARQLHPECASVLELTQCAVHFIDSLDAVEREGLWDCLASQSELADSACV